LRIEPCASQRVRPGASRPADPADDRSNRQLAILEQKQLILSELFLRKSIRTFAIKSLALTNPVLHPAFDSVFL
jgi:hypothetical protein